MQLNILLTPAKAKWTKLEAMVGHPERVKAVAKDVVNNFEDRQQVFEGKAMIVAMSRRIAVTLCDEIVKLKPSGRIPMAIRVELKL